MTIAIIAITNVANVDQVSNLFSHFYSIVYTSVFFSAIMPAQQKLREENRRMRQLLAEAVDTFESTKVRMAAVVDELAAAKLELTGTIDKLEATREKLKKQKEMATKHNEWNNYYAYQCLVYRQFIEQHVGTPPDVSCDSMVKFDGYVLSYYLRPYAHFAHQSLVPDEQYTLNRQCLLCGVMIPGGRARGRCVGCARKAWYCSPLCQQTHWPIHRADHKKIDDPGSRPDLTGFA